MEFHPWNSVEFPRGSIEYPFSVHGNSLEFCGGFT